MRKLNRLGGNRLKRVDMSAARIYEGVEAGSEFVARYCTVVKDVHDIQVPLKEGDRLRVTNNVRQQTPPDTVIMTDNNNRTIVLEIEQLERDFDKTHLFK